MSLSASNVAVAEPLGDVVRLGDAASCGDADGIAQHGRLHAPADSGRMCFSAGNAGSKVVMIEPLGDTERLGDGDGWRDGAMRLGDSSTARQHARDGDGDVPCLWLRSVSSDVEMCSRWRDSRALRTQSSRKTHTATSMGSGKRARIQC